MSQRLGWSVIATAGDKGEHGYLLRNGAFSSIDVPGAATNAQGDIPSTYCPRPHVEARRVGVGEENSYC